VYEWSVKLDRVPLQSALIPAEVLRGLSGQPWPFALSGSWAGGGAIVGSCPLHVADRSADPFTLLDSLPIVERCDDAVGGGWFGWLGYRLGAQIEQLPTGPPRPVPVPEFQLAYYDHVLRLDASGQWWFEALVSDARAHALGQRLAELRALLASPPPPPSRCAAPAPFTLSKRAAAAHLGAVKHCRERIVAGEIYQANVCLRLQSTFDGDVCALFERISAPYAAAFAAPHGGIVSLSPELFLRRTGRDVTTAPIKGTIHRPADPGLAAAALRTLRTSSKDAAEHVMIVDLMRNDLGRVCMYGSVQAPRLPDAEAHPGLWHLVSRVRGQLHPSAGNRELLRATFPPGSVTGAPKVQAMRVIAEVESTARELYTGAIGFASPLAGLELSVAIRTLELCNGYLWLGAGGGIVADSNPERELEEALLKARPIAAAVGSRVDAPARALAA
jgi:para-aminobenzoate synthetase/4-amino-4-deoxychorismate lyase